VINLIISDKEYTSWITPLCSALSLLSIRPSYAQILLMYGSIWQSAMTKLEKKKTYVRNITRPKILILSPVCKINSCTSKSHREIWLELLG
jgi:Ni,Fe-hydrogenase III small subunit